MQQVIEKLGEEEWKFIKKINKISSDLVEVIAVKGTGKRNQS